VNQVGIDAGLQKPDLAGQAEHVMEPDELDPYWKLRRPSATPEAELCKCADRPPIVLQDHLSPNPIVCLRCNGEVPPERIGFSAELAEHVAFWKNLHDALFTLWLDSSDYESWARAARRSQWTGDRSGPRGRAGVEQPSSHLLLVVSEHTG
jgi:hypothetical protein